MERVKKTTKRVGKLYVVGVGPGDPELLTLKGARILRQCPVWLVPSSQLEAGNSTAHTIASGAVDSSGKTIIEHFFPMKHVHRSGQQNPKLEKAWSEASAMVVKLLQQGLDVAFPTLGDPAVYSTAYYVLESLQQKGENVEVEVVPGVSSLGATSAAVTLPLCLGSEQLTIIPATFDDNRLRSVLDVCDAVVFMKVYRVIPKLIALLEEYDLVEKAVLVEKTSMQDEIVWDDIRQLQDRELHYFSTLIVRK